MYIYGLRCELVKEATHPTLTLTTQCPTIISIHPRTQHIYAVYNTRNLVNIYARADIFH